MVTILSWNTLESGGGGAWANGWGCPLEIQRREKLIKAINLDGDYDDSKSKAERMLTQERYKRIRKTMLEEFEKPKSRSSSSTTTTRHNGDDDDDDGTIDFLLFQECTAGDFWDEPSGNSSDENSLDNEFFNIFESLYEKVPCQVENEANTEETLQHVYVRRNSGWVPSSSVALQSKTFVGGCLTEFMLCENTENNCTDKKDESLIIVNLHGKSRNMRDPDLRRESISNLWEEIGSHFNDSIDTNNNVASWESRIVLCGDWNTQLSDLIEPFRDASHNSLLEPVVGLLDNATATTDYPFFSTNHEDGFLAQYDGCLYFRTPPELGSPGAPTSYLELEGTSWNITGFMPKGRDGRFSGDHNNFTYYRSNNSKNNENEGVYLNGVVLPGSMPSMGLSDHLRIYTRIHINSKDASEAGPIQAISMFAILAVVFVAAIF